MSNEDYNEGFLQGLADATEIALKTTRLVTGDDDSSPDALAAARRIEGVLLRIREDQQRLAQLPV